MKNNRKLMLVEWMDSHSGDGWQPLDQLEGHATPIYCRSVGWLVSNKGGVTVLVPHISGEKNKGVRLYGTGDIAIPNKAIVSRTVLKVE